MSHSAGPSAASTHARVFAGAGVAVRSLTAFLAAGALVCLTLRPLLPFPDVPRVQPKIEHLQAHADDYDALFLGSSRVYHQIDPAIFDPLAAARGQPVRSFNLGIDAMRPPEDAYLLDQVLAQKPKRLRWVFIELGGIRFVMDAARQGTARAEYWHDRERLALLLRYAVNWEKKRSLRGKAKDVARRMEDILDHCALFARRSVHMGQGAAHLGRALAGGSRAPGWSALGVRRDGFTPGSNPPPDSAAQLRKHQESVAARLRQPAEKDFGDRISQEALEQMLGKIERAGAQPVLLIPPISARRNFYPCGPRGKAALLLDFSDPRRYPELFENRYRLDADHLNVAGAELFTRMLVERWAAAAQARP